MKMREIPLSEASKAELLEFATTTLGLQVHASTGEEKIRARILQAWTRDVILVEDKSDEEAAPAATLEPTPATQEPAAGERQYVTIQLQSDDKPGGKEPLQVSVNGKLMLIPRNKPVEVPEEYVHVMQNAVRREYETDQDGDIIGHTDVPQHGFSIIEPAHAKRQAA